MKKRSDGYYNISLYFDTKIKEQREVYEFLISSSRFKTLFITVLVQKFLKDNGIDINALSEQECNHIIKDTCIGNNSSENNNADNVRDLQAQQFFNMVKQYGMMNSLMNGAGSMFSPLSPVVNSYVENRPAIQKGKKNLKTKKDESDNNKKLFKKKEITIEEEKQKETSYNKDVFEMEEDLDEIPFVDEKEEDWMDADEYDEEDTVTESWREGLDLF